MTETTPKDLKRLAEFLDNKYQGPFGWRFGWDGLLGLIPGVGDLVTSGLSMYVIFRAAALNCPPVILIRMGLNILIENIVDVIPIVGNIFDFAWKSNLKNMALLESHLRNPVQTRRRSKVLVWTIVFLIILSMAGIIVGTYYVLKLIFTSTAW